MPVSMSSAEPTPSPSANARLVDHLTHDPARAAPPTRATGLHAREEVQATAAAKEPSLRVAPPASPVRGSAGSPPTGRRIEQASERDRTDQAPPSQRCPPSAVALHDRRGAGLGLGRRANAQRPRPAQLPGKRAPRRSQPPPRRGAPPWVGSGSAGGRAHRRSSRSSRDPLLRPCSPAATCLAWIGEGRQRGSPKLSS